VNSTFKASSPAVVHGYLLRGSAWVVLARVASMLLSLAVNAMVAHLLAPADLGAFFLLLSLVAIVRTTVQLGLGRTLVRQLAHPSSSGSAVEARSLVVSTLLLATAAGLTLAVLLCTPPGALVLSRVGLSIPLDLRGAVAAWTAAHLIEGCASEAFRGLRRIPEAVVFNGLSSGFLLVLGLLAWKALWAGELAPDLGPVIWLSLLAVAFSALVGTMRLARCLKSPRNVGLRSGASVLKTLLLPSLPVLLSTLIAICVDQLGLWLLAAWSGDETQVALFGSAQRLARLVSTPLLIANAVLPPILAGFHAGGDKGSLTALVRLSASATAGVAALGCLVLGVLGDQALGILFGEFYRQAGGMLVLLAVAQLLAVATGPCGLLLLMTGNQRAHLVMNCLALATLLFGSWVIRDSVTAWSMVWVVFCVAIVQQVACVAAARRVTGVWTVVTFDPRLWRSYWRQLASASPSP
jgi:O-antigen/teichoic acid export membrane protein